MKNIKSCGVLPEQIEYLLITHCHIDHTGGASALKEQLPCIAVAHEKDAVFLEKGDNITTAAGWYGLKIKAFAIEKKLTHARETVLLGGREILAIHVPGHSPGSVVYMLESENRKVLFAQDVHGPLHPILKSNQNDYIESLKKMRDLEAEVLCEGHFGIYEGIDDVRRFIESYMPTGADEQTY